MKKSEKMTYHYFLFAKEGEAAVVDEMGAGERDEVRDRLCRQLIESGLRGEVVSDSRKDL